MLSSLCQAETETSTSCCVSSVLLKPQYTVYPVDPNDACYMSFFYLFLFPFLHTDGTIPLLDADTAHPKLQLSDDNRRVTYSEAQQAYTEHEARFSSFPQVLASCGLEGGRWYWEVDVSMDDGRWKVALCESRIERKGQKDSSRIGFNTYSWCLAYDKRKLEALHNKESVPVKAEGLQRLGVFLDFEDNSLSFFNVTPGGSLALLHSFKHRFSSPVYPAFSVSKTHLAICELFQA